MDTKRNTFRVITAWQLYDNYIKNREYIPSGLAKLDKLTRGFKRKEVTVIGGRPATGKTSLGSSFCRNITTRHSPVLYVTLELSADQLFERLQIRKVQQENEKYDNSIFFICDTLSVPCSYSLVEECIRKQDNEKDLAVVIIDYFQLFAGVETKSRSIILKLKNLAKELNLALVIFSQLARKAEAKAGDIPVLNDLLHLNRKDENIDTVFLLFRDKDYRGNKVNLSIAKHKDFQGALISLES